MNSIDIFTRFEDLRVLCTRPSRRIGGGREPFKGPAPAELFEQVGLSVEECERWIGNDSTERTPEALVKFSEAIDVVTGADDSATFKKVIWASHFVERLALEVEAAKLDAGRTRKGRPASELSDHALRQEILSRRYGLYKAICKVAEEVKREVKANRAYTAAELLAELDRMHKVRRDKAAFESQQGAYGRFKTAQVAGFRGDFKAFQAHESRKRAAKRRADRPAPPPSAVVSTVEANEDGGTKVVETKVRTAPLVTKRRRASDAPPPPRALN